MNTNEKERCEKRERHFKRDVREETWLKSEERRKMRRREETIEKGENEREMRDARGDISDEGRGVRRGQRVNTLEKKMRED